jgi:hypothetical protein
MNEPFFQIDVDGLSTESLMAEIEVSIQAKTDAGIYDSCAMDDIADFDVLKLEDESQFLEYYLKTLRTSWAIDINDFTIPRKPGVLGWLEQKIKSLIWKVLKFYTYRLFSQQREFNSQASQTIIAQHQEYSRRLDSLEKKLEALKASPQIS